MRRKIAKRKRREVLKRARIISEGWEREGCLKRKDCCYYAEIECNGWKICVPEYDELEVWKAALECIEFAEEEPFEEWKRRKGV